MLPPGPGTLPGLIVVSLNSPLLPATTRPNPLKVSSSGFSWKSSGCAYLPWEFACHVSISASFTGLPSPSTTRPCSVMRSPLTLGGATSVTVPAVNPIDKNGPAVCDGVLIVPMSAHHGRRVPAPQHNVEAIRDREFRHGVIPIERRDQPFASTLVRDARVHRIERQQLIA